jgi:uncharacterized iron-regulated protein
MIRILRNNSNRGAAMRVIAFALLGAWAVARADPAPYVWEGRLRADAIVLLGEVHDNAEQHQRRLEILQRALAAGWRPAIAMEQFDREHQVDIDQSRAERPLDAAYLIDKASPEHDTASSGWDWQYYRPYVALALQYGLPLLAANLSRADAEKVFANGYAAVFDEQAVQSLGLNTVPDTRFAAQKREIDLGHCHAMSEQQLPAMTRAQLARDAVMAGTLLEHASGGVILLAGDGHVRRDIGVASWLPAQLSPQVFAVGFLERGDSPPPTAAFDALVVTGRAPRKDPCAVLRHSLKRSKK